MLDINRIRQNMFIIQQLARRDKRRENASTSLGQVWQILNPFINMMVLVVLFSTIFKTDSFVNYPLYICTGTLIYEFFLLGTNGCMHSLVSNRQFLIKTTIDKNIYVLVKIYVALINLFFSLIIYAGMMIWFKIPFRFINLLVIVDVALFSVFVLGVGKILAVIYVNFADIDYLYKIITLFIFYGTAIFYKPERLTPVLQVVMSWNPIYIGIAIARQLLIDGIFPSIHLWMKLGFYAFVFYLLGSLIFNKMTEDIVAKL
ncbi:MULTISPECIES: ABC transporter permease [Pseudobutyrivibrio]|uniref:Transport permease protein n=1 Tax=Pseudobutyrivibrio xylanivorans TaxID=185007 RepID=A0A1G5S3P8_PSEXY|nr:MULTISPECIES: ABC transporter permease [Pseudobutyrivibrio]MDC7280671.1 ABC transporter permease [Butyrivibrio fibrisolvens]SCZ80788.1 ABC-2 type transport system permease protein [Pseudobutyrivibrio xylanivorans]